MIAPHGNAASEARRRPADLRASFAVVMLAAAILAPTIPGRELMSPDEPRFALVAKEMYERGDPVLPTRGGRPYLDKPPLLFWAIAGLFAAAGGPGEVPCRVPSLVATLLTVLVLHRAARSWVGRRQALLAASIYPTFLLVLERGAWCATDALLTAFVTGTVAALDRGRRPLAGALCLSGGLLTKGPVALVFLGLAWAADRVAGRRAFRPAALLRPGPLALLLGTALSWPVAFALRVGPGVLLSSVWRQNVERFVRSWDNIEPFWYFAWALPAALFPWSLLLAVPLRRPRVLRALLARPAVRWLAAWALAATLFFSLPAGKRGVYLMPVLPALAVVAAAAFDLLRRLKRCRRELGAAGALLGAAAAGGAALAAGGWLLPREMAALAPVRAGSVVLLALLAAGSILFAVLAAAGRAAAVAGPVGFAVGAGLLFPPLFTPALNAAGGARAFARRATAVVPPGTPVGLTRDKWELITWYTGWRPLPLEGPEAVRRHLAGPGPRHVAGTPAKLGPRDTWPAGTRIVLRGRVGRDRLVLLERDGAERYRKRSETHGRPVDKPPRGS
ncbi:MAG: hypothetical protein D6718_06870 [Acidobacteria bacterium]|nr:MAG: hypothetical protein D6718_06870 [Acidobacteriota bacterium]